MHIAFLSFFFRYMKIPEYRPEILAFFSGALVLVFEILWSRVVGPYIGTSLFVWTSLIAIILAALSLGYYYGGKLADRNADMKTVAAIFLAAWVSILVLIGLKNIVLSTLTTYIQDIRYSSILAATLLFTPTSFLLGMISPIVTKIRMTDLATGGQVVGKIGSIGTIGSIIGTLAAGFLLIPFFGVSYLLIFIGITCIILSLISEYKVYLPFQIGAIVFFLLAGYATKESFSELARTGVHIYDTPYSHITISERLEGRYSPVRDLKIDDVTHAGMFLGSNNLLYEYTKYYHLFDVLNPEAQNMLMLGGAAYSFPKSFLENYPDKNLDVVEIDSEITDIARTHFRLKDDPRLSIMHQDARVFLNTSEKKYDAILGDAFGSFYSVPYQLTTRETAQRKYDMLTENWVVILNIIGTLEGDASRFIASEYKTYTEVFPEVFLLPVSTMHKNEVQNIMLIAAKNPQNLSFETSNQAHKFYLWKKMYPNIPEDTLVLTDDFAPVDYYVSALTEAR